VEGMVSKEPFGNEEVGRVFTDAFQTDHTQVIIGFTTRDKGFSDVPYDRFNLGLHVGDQPDIVIKNRELLADDLKFPLDNWVMGEQVHSNRIERVMSRDRGKGARELSSALPLTDGLYTTDPNLLLLACYADCVPVYFIAPDEKAVGIAHAGWRGTVGEIAGRMIQEWEEELQLSADEIQVIIGPSIGMCCYEVDERVASAVEQLEGVNKEGLLQPTQNGHYQLNLQLTNKRILEKYGVLSSNIYISTYCTSCRTDRFYSHRKENGKTGRMLGYIGILEEISDDHN
jgi:polyphenol oxidase